MEVRRLRYFNYSRQLQRKCLQNDETVFFTNFQRQSLFYRWRHNMISLICTLKLLPRTSGLDRRRNSPNEKCNSTFLIVIQSTNYTRAPPQVRPSPRKWTFGNCSNRTFRGLEVLPIAQPVSLRSSTRLLLRVPRRLKLHMAVALSAWLYRPSGRNCPPNSLPFFCKRLQTHLFSDALEDK